MVSSVSRTLTLTLTPTLALTIVETMAVTEAVTITSTVPETLAFLLALFRPLWKVEKLTEEKELAEIHYEIVNQHVVSIEPCPHPLTLLLCVPTFLLSSQPCYRYCYSYRQH